MPGFSVGATINETIETFNQRKQNATVIQKAVRDLFEDDTNKALIVSSIPPDYEALINSEEIFVNVTYIPISARYNSAQTNINRDVFPHIVEFLLLLLYIYTFNLINDLTKTMFSLIFLQTAFYKIPEQLP